MAAKRSLRAEVRALWRPCPRASANGKLRQMLSDRFAQDTEVAGEEAVTHIEARGHSCANLRKEACPPQLEGDECRFPPTRMYRYPFARSSPFLGEQRHRGIESRIGLPDEVGGRRIDVDIGLDSVSVVELSGGAKGGHG